jgi:serine/threonine-protein kinase
MAASELRTHARSAALIVAFLLFPRAARAGDPAAAEALFREGRQLMKDGQLDRACRKLEESQALDPGMGTLFNLALCYEAQGRLATAWGTYNEVAAEAKAAGQPERERVAHDRGLVLEPRLSRATVRVAQPAPQRIDVRRDGAQVGPSQWGTPIPVDPGAHTIQATAPGYLPYASTFEVHGDAQRVDVEVPALRAEPQPPAPPSPSPPPSPQSSVERTQRAAVPQQEASSLRVPLAVGAASLGAIALGLGTYFGIQAFTDHSQANPYCNGDSCQQPGYDLRQSAIGAGNASTALFAAGGAALAASGAILLFWPDRRGANVALHAGGIDLKVAW